MNIVWSALDQYSSGNILTYLARSVGQSGTFGSPQALIIGNDSWIATDPQGNIGITSGLMCNLSGPQTAELHSRLPSS